MELLIKKISNIYRWDYFPFIIYAGILLLGRLLIPLDFGDDIYFSNVLNDQNIIAYLISRYNNWTSRIFIEAVLVVVAKYSIIWRILDVGIMILISVSISKLTTEQPSRKINWIIMYLSATLSYTIYNSAGWMATTLNYSWPLAFGLFSMISIKKIILNQKIRGFEYALYIFAFIFAANAEQMCAILLGVYFVFTLYIYHSKKIVNWYMIVQTLIGIASMVFVLTNPGNKMRQETVYSMWPGYSELSLIRKIEMGYSSTWYEMIMQPNLLFTLFCGLIFVGILIKYNKSLYRWLAFLPLLASLVFGVFSPVLSGIFPFIDQIQGVLTDYGTGLNLSSFKSWVPDLILTAVFLAILVSLFLIFDDKKYAVLSILIVLVGFASRMIMIMTPQIRGAGSRVFIFMYFSLILVAVLLYQVILKSNSDLHVKVSKNVIYVVGCLALLSNFYLTIV